MTKKTTFPTTYDVTWHERNIHGNKSIQATTVHCLPLQAQKTSSVVGKEERVRTPLVGDVKSRMKRWTSLPSRFMLRCTKCKLFRCMDWGVHTFIVHESQNTHAIVIPVYASPRIGNDLARALHDNADSAAHKKDQYQSFRNKRRKRFQCLTSPPCHWVITHFSGNILPMPIRWSKQSTRWRIQNACSAFGFTNFPGRCSNFAAFENLHQLAHMLFDLITFTCNSTWHNYTQFLNIT